MRTQQISPSVSAIAVTPSDTVDLLKPSTKGWSVNSNGYVKMLLQSMSDTDTPITVFAAAGARYPDSVRRFMVVSSSAATGIIVYY